MLGKAVVDIASKEFVQGSYLLLVHALGAYLM